MIKFNQASLDSFIITFGDEISLELSKVIKYYFEEIKNIDKIIEIIPSYTTILITFDIFKTTFQDLEYKINKIKYKNDNNLVGNKILEIPAYYGLEVGIDLERISQKNNIKIEDIIKIHTSSEYTVFTIGFAPGFAYLGSVDERIACARLESPRKMVTKGSVAIADTQTAIYPQNSPGGWNIIASTTYNMFDKRLASLCPLNMGDKIKFKSISKNEFIDLGGIV